MTYPDAFQSNGPTLGEKADSLRGTSTTRSTAPEPTLPESSPEELSIIHIQTKQTPRPRRNAKTSKFYGERRFFGRERGRKENLLLDDHSFQQ